MERDRIPVRMPPNPMPHVIARLIEVGLTGTNGMGPTPLSWIEIDAWQRLTCLELMPWEARLLRQLSTAYVAEGLRAEAENCLPPWRATVTAEERQSEHEALLALFRGKG